MTLQKTSFRTFNYQPGGLFFVDFFNQNMCRYIECLQQVCSNATYPRFSYGFLDTCPPTISEKKHPWPGPLCSRGSPNLAFGVVCGFLLGWLWVSDELIRKKLDSNIKCQISDFPILVQEMFRILDVSYQENGGFTKKHTCVFHFWCQQYT